MNVPLSILDTSPAPTGSTAAQALRNTVALAQEADRLGYTRYWLAEHHNFVGAASAAPEIMIGHVARETERIRVGSGGIMLPNHAPLKVAETFRLLETLYPGRIDLGIGRAPGTDPVTALALRRSPAAVNADEFPALLAELLAFSEGGFPDDHPFRAVAAIPSETALPPLWLLGSSDFGAQVAASLGVGFAFASHINPHGAADVLQLYRERFVQTGRTDRPHAILTVSVVCAETDEQADYLASSVDLAFLKLRTGQAGKLPSPQEALSYPYTERERLQTRMGRDHHIVGSASTVKARIDDLVDRSAADEVMILTMVHSHEDRVRSYRLLADAYALHRGDRVTVAV